MSGERETFEGWCVLELMGHRRLGGYVREATIGGASFIRIDTAAEPSATQFYAPGAVYAITPCTEAAARAVAAHNRPEPVQSWEIPQRRLEQGRPIDVDADDDEDEALCPHGLLQSYPCEACASDDDAEAAVAAHRPAQPEGEDDDAEDERP